MSLKLTPRVALLLIASLFVVPLALAWMMYSGTIDYRPGSTRNFGALVEPPLPLTWSDLLVDGTAVTDAANPFAGHWLVLHAVPNPCAEACWEVAADLRQIHRAAGRNQSRIRLALLHDLRDGESARRLQDIYPSFHLLENPNLRLWDSLNRIAGRTTVAGTARGAVFLVDPLGNIMMAYEAGSDPNGLNKDLKRLMTWSKLDEHK